MHALGYYRQAQEHFASDAAELVVLLKDRGWLHILRRDWLAAAADLEQALALAADAPVRADALDALASLHRNQRQFSAAIGYAQKSLALREEHGDLLRVAKSPIYLPFSPWNSGLPPPWAWRSS